MRARQRHFNPAHAGATAAFDARFGIAVADNAAVDTWSNRTGTNDATQATSTRRPTFKATGGSNNTPALLFDGTTDTLGHSISLTTAPALVMSVAVRTGGSGFQTLAAFMPPNTANFNIMYGRWDPTANWGFAPSDSGQSILNTWTICSAVPNSTATSNSTTTMWSNGANEVTTAAGSRYAGDVSDRRAIGATTSAGEAHLTGSISQVVMIPATVGDPLRRRLERAAGYSFKISCS